MERFLLVRPPPLCDDVILALKSINLKADDTKEVVEFKLQGKMERLNEEAEAYEAMHVTYMALG